MSQASSKKQEIDVRDAPVQSAQFHVGISMCGTVMTGFDVDHLKNVRRLDAAAWVVGCGILLKAGNKTKIVPFSNIKELDLK